MIQKINNYEFDFFAALVEGDVPKTALFLKEFTPKHYFNKNFTHKNISAEKYSTPIHIACGCGITTIAALLFQAAKNNYTLLNAKNYLKKDTSLHLMIRYSRFELFQLLYYTQQNQFAKCLTLKNISGDTPFLLASKHPDLRYVELLIRAGSPLDEENFHHQVARELIFSAHHFPYETRLFNKTAYDPQTGSNKIYNYFEIFMCLRLLLHAFAERQKTISINLKIVFPEKTPAKVFECIQLYECNPRVPTFDSDTKKKCLDALTLPFALNLIHTINKIVTKEWLQQMQKKQFIGSIPSFDEIAIAYLKKTTPHLHQTACSEVAVCTKYGTSKIETLSLILRREYQCILPEILSIDLPLFQADLVAWKMHLQKRRRNNYAHRK